MFFPASAHPTLPGQSEIADAQARITIQRLSKGSSIYRLRFRLRRPHRADLERFERALGVRGVIDQVMVAGAPEWEIEYCSLLAVEVLRRLLPHLRLQKDQAELAMHFWRDAKSARGAEGVHFLAMRELNKERRCGEEIIGADHEVIA